MVDKAKVEEAIKLLLEGIGEDVDREGLQGTPERIARMCEEIYGGLDKEADEYLQKQFHVENNEMVLEKDITFYSMCEHHLMPFYGKAHVAYIPNGKVTGLSKLARTVDLYARRPQIQEHLTVQIADALERVLDPKGIMIMLEAEHTCMTMRGIKKPGSKTITTVTRGEFKENHGTSETVPRHGQRLMDRVNADLEPSIVYQQGASESFRFWKRTENSADIHRSIFWMLQGLLISKLLNMDDSCHKRNDLLYCSSS